MRPKGWKTQVAQGLGLVLTVAVVGRLAWELLSPLIPAVAVILCLLGLLGFLISKWRR